ncbi:MAG: protein-glutamate O-methyltransferase CheR [Planctomycetota bacterium]
MTVSPAAFEFIRRHVREHSAIVLDDTKLYLVELRLQPLLAEAGLKTIDDLALAVRDDPRAPLARRVVESICTNETSFFRDPGSFEALRRTILPQLVAARAAQRQLRIWCAACSSGQEPYSVAMTLVEHFPELASWRVEILATDLSTPMIERSRAGVFSQFEVGRGLPAISLVKHFEQSGSEWRIRESLRRMVQFRSLNLSQAFGLTPGFDLVLLRNVLIYFDLEARTRVLRQVHEVLSPAGFLLLGAAENMLGLDVGLERALPERTACDRRRLKPAA